MTPFTFALLVLVTVRWEPGYGPACEVKLRLCAPLMLGGRP